MKLEDPFTTSSESERKRILLLLPEAKLIFAARLSESQIVL